MEATRIPDSRTRVLVVDDSALMRRHISQMLESSSRIEVCGLAHDGDQAVELAQKLRPDVITLDVDMPTMDGVEAIPAILQRHPVPIIMLSTLTQRGAEVTLNALDAGAVDFIAKPSSAIPRDVKRVRDTLVAKVLAFTGTNVRPPPTGPRTKPTPVVTDGGEVSNRRLTEQCVVIGISTGGPPALREVFEAMRPPFPPIVVVQHMPAKFTASFAFRLNNDCPFEVKEAAQGDEVRPNRVLIAPGSHHVELRGRGSKRTISLNDEGPVSGHMPSVDVLFRSAALLYGPNLTGVIMTGMGRDGADGCKAIVHAGGKTLGQDQTTSVVYGMNAVAFREGGVQQQFSLDKLANILMSLALNDTPLASR